MRGDEETKIKKPFWKVYFQEKAAKIYANDIFGELWSDMYDFELKLVITSKGF